MSRLKKQTTAVQTPAAGSIRSADGAYEKGTNTNGLWSYLLRNRVYYYMLIPGVILLIIFRFVPLYGMLIAFKDYDLNSTVLASPWVGLKWFKLLFGSPDFYNILRNSIVINLLEIAFCFTASVVFAVLINEVTNSALKKVVQTVSYLPHFLSWVIVGGLITQMVSPTSYIMQTVSGMLGIRPQNLLLYKNAFYPILICGDLWKECGWGTILYLAAMSGISPELYEAAKIDGAGKLQRIRHITLPGIKFIVVISLIMRCGSIIGVGFEKIFVLQNGINMSISDVFSTYNYRVGIGRWNIELSTALSWFESIVGLVMVLSTDRIAKLLGEEGIW